MKYCAHCGKELMDEAVVCPNCGCPAGNTNANTNTSINTTGEVDAPNTGWLILGLFIPIVGLILYLMNKDKLPLKAKSAGKGALIGFIVGIVLSIFSSFFLALLPVLLSSMY